MIFRQLFDSTSFSYTYLIAAGRGGEALIIDPVLDRVDRYIQLLDELDLRLVKALDSHLHADHITGLGALRDRTKCITDSRAPRRAGCRSGDRRHQTRGRFFCGEQRNRAPDILF